MKAIKWDSFTVLLPSEKITFTISENGDGPSSLLQFLSCQGDTGTKLLSLGQNLSDKDKNKLLSSSNV